MRQSFGGLAPVPLGIEKERVAGGFGRRCIHFTVANIDDRRFAELPGSLMQGFRVRLAFRQRIATDHRTKEIRPLMGH